MSLDAEDAETLVGLAERRIIRGGTPLFQKGDPGDRLYGVVTGCLKVCATNLEGREVTFAVLSAGDIVGELAVTSAHPRSATVIAVSDSELASIERKRLDSVMTRRPAVLSALVEASATTVRRLTDRAEDAAFLSLDARLAKTLVELSQRIGQPRNAGTEIRFRQQDLADMLSASRESVNKRLRDWEDHTFLQLRRGTIVVRDIDALRNKSADST